MTRILVVDDAPGHRVFLGAVLRFEGYDVAMADSGPHALEMLERALFDVVLLDQDMPVMAGLQLYRVLASWPNCPRVIFITVLGGEAVFDPLRPHVLVLTKPVTPSQVIEAVSRVLAR